jgi:drug/metabolite transporter (DMT)-like permease
MNKVVLPDNWFSINTAQLFFNKYILLGLTCYGLSMLFWLYVLTKVDVSRAYPFVGLGFIGTMLFAYYFLHEPVTVQKLIGTFLVVSGVVLLAK